MLIRKYFNNRKSKGQGVVEFALVITILLTIIYGIFEVSRLVFVDSIVVTAAREAARYGAATGVVPGKIQYKDCAGIRAAAENVDFLNVIDPSLITIRYINATADPNSPSPAGMTSCPPTVPIESGFRIRVEVQATFTPMEGLVPLNTLTLRSSNVKTLLGKVSVAGPADPPSSDLPVLSVVKPWLGDGTVSSIPAGINCPTGCDSASTDPVPFDSTFTLKATADPGSTFMGWSGGDCPDNDPSYTSCSVTLSNARQVIAYFFLDNAKTVRVTTSGLGYGIVTTNPVGITCGPSNATCMTQFTPDITELILAADPDPDTSSSLIEWKVNGDDMVCPLGSPVFAPDVAYCTIPLTGLNTTIEAVFDSPVKKLTLLKTGFGLGTVTSVPAGINCGIACSSGYHDYDNGTNVTLTAFQDEAARSEFTSWTGCDSTGTDADGYPTCIVKMTKVRYVSVNFDSPDKKTLKVTKPDTNTGDGIVSSSPVGLTGGISCGANCSDAFNVNTVVKLSAWSDASSVFSGWSGACSGPGICTVTMDRAKFVTAVFEHAAPPPCVFTWTEPVYTNSARTITWNIQNTIPGSNVEISDLFLTFAGDTLNKITLDGVNTPPFLQGPIIPVGVSVPGNGKTLSFGNHTFVLSYQKPDNILHKTITIALNFVPANCNIPYISNWTVH